VKLPRVLIFRSLFFKIFMWFWLAAAMMFGAWNLMFWTSLSQMPQPEARRGAFGESLNLYAESAVQVYDREGPQAFEQYVARSQKESGTEIFLFDGLARPITPATDAATEVAAEVRDQQKHVAHNVLGRLIWGRSVEAASGRMYIFITRLRQPVLPRPDAYSPGRLVVSILIAGMVCYFLALYLTSPVKKLQSTVKAFASGNLEARVSPQLGNRADELANLGREFDQMAERIEGLISSQKRLLADISHELRTPLARLTVALELARKSADGRAVSAHNRIEQETERVNQLVGQLLTLTKLESGSERVPPEIVVLEEIVHQVIDDADYEAKPLHRCVKSDELEHCRVRGSFELLRSAIENVVRNAVRYTAEGTCVEVGLHWRLDTAILTVRDHGPGVPEAELQHIFEPFYRVSEARERSSGGVGLGLSIAHRTVKLHGGNIRADNAKDGLVVTIELPLAPNAAPVQSHPEKTTV
jgi:signal transduction histidine kinase